jgi:ATP-dependent DNA ligase
MSMADPDAANRDPNQSGPQPCITGLFLQPTPRAITSVEVSRVAFIPPAIPRLRPSPPSGKEWLHEVKLEGFRVQIHKHGQAVTIYSKNGSDFTRRFPTITAAVLALPVRSCVVDGELIAAGAHGKPDFLALLHGRHVPKCVYCLDGPLWRRGA